MKIKRLSLWHVPLTSKTTYYMAEGKSCDTVETVVLCLETDTGVSGWGETCPIPHYLPAYARGIAPALEELAPVILGADPVGPEALMAKADAYLIGHAYAKSALDIALWDITAKVAGLRSLPYSVGKGAKLSHFIIRSPALHQKIWQRLQKRHR